VARRRFGNRNDSTGLVEDRTIGKGAAYIDSDVMRHAISLRFAEAGQPESQKPANDPIRVCPFR
jgi:hypothetical protein